MRQREGWAPTSYIVYSVEYICIQLYAYYHIYICKNISTFFIHDAFQSFNVAVASLWAGQATEIPPGHCQLESWELWDRCLDLNCPLEKTSSLPPRFWAPEIFTFIGWFCGPGIWVSLWSSISEHHNLVSLHVFCGVLFVKVDARRAIRSEVEGWDRIEKCLVKYHYSNAVARFDDQNGTMIPWCKKSFQTFCRFRGFDPIASLALLWRAPSGYYHGRCWWVRGTWRCHFYHVGGFGRFGSFRVGRIRRFAEDVQS